MSQPGHDNSHDWQHILRVLSNAHHILTWEKRDYPSRKYEELVVYLCALLHDIGDRKYAKPGENVENQVSNFLISQGLTKESAEVIQTVVKHVSYTQEKRDPASVRAVLQKYPELAIVQDADRLDAIGAIGTARCFSFGAAKFPDQPMSRAIEHFEEKLYSLKDMMKTTRGMFLAMRRHAAMRNFQDQWEEESELGFELA